MRARARRHVCWGRPGRTAWGSQALSDRREVQSSSGFCIWRRREASEAHLPFYFPSFTAGLDDGLHSSAARSKTFATRRQKQSATSVLYLVAIPSHKPRCITYIRIQQQSHT